MLEEMAALGVAMACTDRGIELADSARIENEEKIELYYQRPRR